MFKKDKQSCSVTTCLSTRHDLRFKFPSKVNEGILWLKHLNDDNLNKLSYEEIIKLKLSVCHRHFAPDCYITDRRGFKRLKGGFYPINKTNGSVQNCTNTDVSSREIFDAEDCLQINANVEDEVTSNNNYGQKNIKVDDYLQRSPNFSYSINKDSSKQQFIFHFL